MSIVTELELDFDSVFLESVKINPNFSNTNLKVYLNFKSGKDMVTGVFGIKGPEESPRGGWSQKLPEFEKQFLGSGDNIHVGKIPRIERKKIVKTVRKRGNTL